jgi:hypothetical protein
MDKLTTTKRIAILSRSDRDEVRGKALRAVDGGGSRVLADRDVIDVDETWTVEQHGDGRCSIQSRTGLYLSAQPDGSLEWRTDVGEWELFVIDPSPFAPAPPTGGQGPWIRGALRINGRMFANDAGLYRPVWASCLAALRPGHDYGPALDQITLLGFGGVRVFAGPLPWTQPATALRSVYDRLPTFLGECAARGLYVEVTALTETGLGYDKGAHLDRIAEILPSRGHCVLELANEFEHHSQNLDVQWLRQRATLNRDHWLTAIGAPNEDEPSDPAKGPQTWGGTGGSYGTAHLDRGRDTWNQVRRVREIEACSAFAKMPVLNNEPIGAAEPGTPGQRRTDPEFFFTLGALNRLFEVGGVFHSQSGLLAEPLGPVQTACAQAFVRGSRIWPIDGPRLRYMNSNVNGGWSDSPVQSHNVNTCVRAYAGVADGRGFVVALGLSGDPQLRIGAGYREVGVLGEMPGVKVIEVTR